MSLMNTELTPHGCAYCQMLRRNQNDFGHMTVLIHFLAFSPL